MRTVSTSRRCSHKSSRDYCQNSYVKTIAFGLVNHTVFMMLWHDIYSDNAVKRVLVLLLSLVSIRTVCNDSVHFHCCKDSV